MSNKTNNDNSMKNISKIMTIQKCYNLILILANILIESKWIWTDKSEFSVQTCVLSNKSLNMRMNYKTDTNSGVNGTLFKRGITLTLICSLKTCTPPEKHETNRKPHTSKEKKTSKENRWKRDTKRLWDLENEEKFYKTQWKENTLFGNWRRIKNQNGKGRENFGSFDED